MEGGRLLLETENSAVRTQADQFFKSAINLAKDDKEKASLLKRIGVSYNISSDTESKRTAIEYYKQAALVYQNLQDRNAQVNSILAAGQNPGTH